MLYEDEIVCKNCGLIQQEQITNTPERVTDNKGESREFLQQETLPDLEITTFNSKNTKNKELKRVFRRLHYYTENNSVFFKISSDIKRIATQLKLPNFIKKEAEVICAKIFRNKKYKWRHIKKACGEACLRLGAKSWGAPLTFDEIAEFSDYDKKEIKTTYLFIRKIMNIKQKQISVIQIIDKNCRDIIFDRRERSKIINLAKKVDNDPRRSGKSLRSYAAAIVYYVKNNPKKTINADVVADTFRTTRATMVKRRREIERYEI